ncbi:MAG TPA: hypothetical protein PKE27_15215 [Povalibacter sp.]|uniref:glycoside hydrolase family 2 protein n=1 Tax=Povalibacter sp. TaxID=1962978 RepID=UPI002C81BAF5|nr:hypothetical protein [Povalibacter sp.]HMN45927.1 hypothetical protein [Povalibacter sp.]
MNARIAEVRSDADAAELHWQFAATAPNAAAAPNQLEADASWFAAPVPGTVAGALLDAGRLDIDSPASLTDRDYWYRSDIAGHGERVLRLHGLATLAEVWLDDGLLLRSENMFVRHDVRIELKGSHRLWLCFRALDNYTPPSSRRARWRPAMIPRRSLRSLRTSLLGHMPGWCPNLPIVGPWRPIELLDPRRFRVEQRRLRATLHADGSGTLDVELSLQGPAPHRVRIECAGATADLVTDGTRWRGRLSIDRVEPWWPHTHGRPHLYPVTLSVPPGAAQRINLGQVGFRRLRIDTGADGNDFALYVNDVPVFCRGANWLCADIARLPETRETYLPWINRMREAHLNMVRVGGTTLYEATSFYELCDETGLLVWQDFMFANFDYPADDPAFRSSVVTEARQFLERTSGSPSLCVLCGGSEVAQQAAMLGLPRDTWRNPLFDEWLPAIARELRPDVVYVGNSPHGGPLPFVADAGVSHYYGVGAYRRPLDDARHAQVRFASECLAFANVPEPAMLRIANLDPGQARWKQRTPRDAGAEWDFEDVRDHYLTQLFDVDAAALRSSDIDRYLTLSRATTAEVMEATLGEWRRSGSSCNGALVWTLHDPWPGAGWGIVDSTGEPKSTWYALRRACRPQQIVLTDEGVNGLAIHCINERAAPLSARIEFTCYAGAHAVASASRTVRIAARTTARVSAWELLGTFFDVTYAYRFGPPAHEVAVATLFDDESATPLAEAFHFAIGRHAVREIERIDAQVLDEDGRWWLVLQSPQPAVSVHIEDEHYRAADNWFHLAPQRERRIDLLARHQDAPPPAGRIMALNCPAPIAYRARSP